MNKIITCLILLLLSLIPNLYAKDWTKTITVSPGSIKNAVWITPFAKPGDKLLVTFVAAKNYKLISAKVEDKDKLGWKATKQPFTFELTVTTNHKVGVALKAKFSGMLESIALGNVVGTSKPDLLPWDLEGQFQVLGECEGVGDDLGRANGQFVSLKPGQPVRKDGKKYTPEGVMTFNTEIGDFVGSFKGDGVDEGKTFFGEYRGNLQPDTLADEFLEPAQILPCPEKPSVQVHFAYYGVKDEKKIGGKTLPDEIFVNEPDLAILKKLQADLARQQKIVDALEADEIKATKKLEEEKAKLKELIDAYNAWLEKAIADKVLFAKNAVKTAQEDLNKLLNNVKDTKSYRDKLADAQKKLADAQAALVKAIQSAREELEKSPKAITKQKIIATQQAVVKASQDELTAITLKTDKETTNLEKIQKSVTAFNEALKDWLNRTFAILCCLN